MGTENAEIMPQGTVDGLLPWSRPKVQRLTIHLETQGIAGSDIDGEGGELFESDVRLKRDIAGIKDALNGVLALDGVRFSYDASKYPEMGLSKDPQLGFIAQDLEQVYPELVTTRDNGFKAVKYAQLVPVLVEAIKEQQSLIADLQEQVNELQHASKVAAR
jgi:hypothetical protein